jgi:hypothetical protein
MTKWILAIFISFFAINAQADSAKLPGNVAVLIAKRHYEHPVRLLHPYLDVWHMKGPMAEKVAVKAIEKRFANSSLCSVSKNADVVLLIEPQMFYNAQLRVFHAEMIVKAYAPLTEAPNTENFAYAKAMDKVIKSLETDKAFLALLNNGKTNTAETQCGALNDLPTSKIYY